MKNAYVVGQISIKDHARWVEYRDQVPATLVPWDAELVFRGQLSSVLAGSHSHTDTVVLRFPSLESANGWHSSEQYQALVALRNQAADVDLLVCES